MDDTEQTQKTETLRRAQSMRESILDQIEDERERSQVAEVLKSVTGIDAELGIAQTPPEKEGLPDPPGLAGEAAAAAEAPPAEVVDLQKQIRERDARLKALESERVIADAEPQIREQASQAVQSAMAKAREQDAADAARLKKFTDDYGSDAAAALKEQIDLNRRLRSDQVQALQAREAENIRNQLREQVTTQSDLDFAPKLKKWTEDFRAHQAGDTSKSRYEFDLARAIETQLLGDPEWAARNQAERFREIEKRVEALGVGGRETGSTGAEKQSGTRDRTSPDAPGSMSDIDGGQTGAVDTASALDRLSQADFHDLVTEKNLTPAQIEELGYRALG